MLRGMLVAGLICVAASAAFAQGGGAGAGKGKAKPPPPPVARCADLAIANYGLAIAAADAPADEIAVSWEVRNAGNATYLSTAGQSLALEFVTPGGAQQLALTSLPQTADGQVAVGSNAALAPGASWRGNLRATLTPESARWPLRLRVVYAPTPYATATNDCDTGNNTIEFRRR